MRMIRALLPVSVLLGLLTSCNSSAANAADLDSFGEIGVRKMTAPFDNVLCSGQPTEAQFDALQAAGVTKIVHLRLAKEKGTGWEEQHAAGSSIEFVRLPIAGKAGLTRPNVQRFAELMADAGEGHTLVSCGSSNRVGAMFALKARWHDGKSAAEAMAIGKSAGMKALTSTVAKLVEDAQ